MRTAIRAIEKFLGDARHMASQVRHLAQTLEESARSAQELSTRFTHLGEHSRRPHGFHSVDSGIRPEPNSSWSAVPEGGDLGHLAMRPPGSGSRSPRLARRVGPGTGFLAGAAIGACMALLFAPRSGREVRRRIGNRLELLQPGSRGTSQATQDEPAHEGSGE